MLDLIYRGSVKDVRGPLLLNGHNAVVFDYSDAYSVFDWGRMPDALPKKGAALAWMAAVFFERLEDPAQWKEFSKSPEALALRRGNKTGLGGSAFMETGERLQTHGLRTHFIGLGPELKKTTELTRAGTNQITVKQVEATKPALVTLLGRTVPDYSSALKSHSVISKSSKLIPLEVVFRFSLPPGSSLIGRVQSQPQYLVTRGFGEYPVQPGAQYEFPILELFTKLEPKDRELELSEAAAIAGAYAGLSTQLLQEMLYLTAWVAAFLRHQFSRVGLDLADGKLEWAIASDGSLMLVDAIGPDELRVLDRSTQIQVSKECLRQFYRESAWYKAVENAKNQAHAKGVLEWKRFVTEQPESLKLELKSVVSEMYLALANAVSGRIVFEGVRGLPAILADLKRLSA